MKEGIETRLSDSVEMSIRLAGGTVLVAPEGDDELTFSQAFACPVHGISMDEPQPRDFSFNNPYGACPDCLGLGSRLEPDPDLIVPDKTLSLAEGAVKPFAGGQTYYPQLLAAVAKHLDVSVDTPYEDLPRKVQDALMNGLGDRRIKIDYVTRDGRETYWYTRFEGALPAVRGSAMTSATCLLRPCNRSSSMRW